VQAPYRFSVEEFQRMLDADVFAWKGRLELIEGQVSYKMVPNPPHDDCVEALDELITGFIPPGWRVRIQSGITLTQSVTLPDVCVARGTRHTFATRRPGPADIVLLVEVADSSLGEDPGVKAQTYARDSIAEYWIVNVPERQIEVYTQPSGPTATPGYAQTQVYSAGSAVPLVLDGVSVGTIAVNDVIA
jgi:Uma2 family endonuclease